MTEIQGEPLAEANDAIQRVNHALMAFRGDDNGLNHILTNVEYAYLETYVAWRVSTDSAKDRDKLLSAHHRVRDHREKLHQMKKLVDELDCEGDRLLQSLHALRT